MNEELDGYCFMICWVENATECKWEIVSGEDAMQNRVNDLLLDFYQNSDEVPLVFRMEHEIDNEAPTE